MLFPDVKLDSMRLTFCVLSYKDSCDNYRLYSKAKKDGGFDFVLLKFNSCPYTEEKDLWSVNTKCSIVLDGWAVWDGVRHLTFCDKGFLNYPDLGVLSEVFKVLKDLEKEYCTNIEDWDVGDL